MKRLYAAVLVGAALFAGACDFNLNAPEELRTVHIICPASGDTIKVVVHGEEGYDISGCGEFPDSLVIVTP